MRKISVDGGFGGYKVAEVIDDTLNVVNIPAVVGVGDTETGLLSVGVKRSRRLDQPLQITIEGLTYLVGPNVHLYARPIERLDFRRLSEGPELLALTLAGIWQLVGRGQHTLALVIGLPVEVMQGRELAQETLRTLRQSLVGEHLFSVNTEETLITIEKIKVIAQPTGTFFDWGLDYTGQPRPALSNLKDAPVAIADIGFNTVDLFALQGSNVVARFTGGNTQGMRRAAEMMVRLINGRYQRELSLHEADQLLRQTASRKVINLYTADGQVNVRDIAQQALDDTAGAIVAFVNRLWGNGRQFQHLLLTGGGAQILQAQLLRHYPHAVIPAAPAEANARGLAKFAQRRGTF